MATISHPKKQITLAFLLFTIGFIHLSAQRMDRISHLRGTKTINGVQVKVTEEGYVDSLEYCGSDTGPYFAGNDYSRSCCKTGSYIFTFSQPIKEVYLNIAALSTSDSYDEEAEIYVNSSHYFVKEIGKVNSCEPIAIISAQGNIRPCNSCSGSGADKIRIKGPITTLKVTCKINKGEPQGMVFAVYMGDKDKQQPFEYTASFVENDAGMGKELIVEADDLKDAEITIKDANGDLMPIIFRSVQSKKIIIDAFSFPSGTYDLEIKYGDAIEKKQLIIE